MATAALRYLCVGLAIGALAFMLAFYVFETPTEENLRVENSELKSRYRQLNNRVEEALKVLEDISQRDDNFYRSVMQTEPINKELRYSTASDRQLTASNEDNSYNGLIAELSRRTNLLEHQLYVQSLSFDELRKSATTMNDRLKRLPSILPLPSVNYPISSGFGYRREPTRGVLKLHEGIDWSVAAGTPVISPADGTVTRTGRNAIDGNFVEIDHGYDYTTRYAHLSDFIVREGQAVAKGETIAHTGSSGKSVGPHLHYEVRYKNVSQNPVDYFFSSLTPEHYEKMLREAENAGVTLD